MSYHVISYHIISYMIILISYHTILDYIVFCYIIFYHVLSYHILSYHVIPYHVIFDDHAPQIPSVPLGLGRAALAPPARPRSRLRRPPRPSRPPFFRAPTDHINIRILIWYIVWYIVIYYIMVWYSTVWYSRISTVGSYNTCPRDHIDIMTLPTRDLRNQT